MKILITGACGFIGSHLTALLLAQGHEVIAVDNLDRQVHPGLYLHDGEGGWTGEWPAHFPADRRVVKSKLDIETEDKALGGLLFAAKPDVVVHLAARVGVGQSASEPADYVRVNALGTARLLEAMQVMHLPARLIVASSMSCYGEGAYRKLGTLDRVRPDPRTAGQVAAHGWDFPHLLPSLTREDDELIPQSVYAESKATTERLALIWGRQRGVSVAACRFFNVYGPYQSARNPYTGIVATFASAALRGEAPRVYEDGGQSRDFIHVLDVVRAVAMLAENHQYSGPVNVCRGRPLAVKSVANIICDVVAEEGGPEVEPVVTGEFRPGDVRHCLGDPALLHKLGWHSTMSFGDGVRTVVRWMLAERAAGRSLDPIGDPHGDLARAGLLSIPRTKPLET